MSLIERLRRLRPGRALIPRAPITYRAIGVVRNHVREARPEGWADVRSDIILRAELGEALDAIEGFSHALVLFHLDLVPEAERRLKLRVGDEAGAAERGVLATRSQLRPNPIGLALVQILHRRKAVLRVRGLDALDGTPVLDVKPYLPPYDAAPEARLPDWAIAPR